LRCTGGSVIGGHLASFAGRARTWGGFHCAKRFVQRIKNSCGAPNRTTSSRAQSKPPHNSGLNKPGEGQALGIFNGAERRWRRENAGHLQRTEEERGGCAPPQCRLTARCARLEGCHGRRPWGRGRAQAKAVPSGGTTAACTPCPTRCSRHPGSHARHHVGLGWFLGMRREAPHDPECPPTAPAVPRGL
jgi:hypothetical protein